MKRWMHRLLVGAVLVCMTAATARANSDDDFDETQTHPLRVAAYLVHPVGFALEWVIFRPFHYIVSRPGLDKVFGHRPHGENRVY
ncbi:MAG: hypothetical protein KatS3mg077_1446 [Candidatus Binatia bacterium]|nr:MAG: hypothetical protein KatS3mg077_1446 [Candidatus Binatia bacterium]